VPSCSPSDICASGVYGTLGVPAAANTPGARYLSSTWTDSSGNLWLFGGQGYNADGQSTWLSDLWAFNPSTLEWTWEGGSNTDAQFGIYGTLGISSDTNFPGSRYGAVSVSGVNGDAWLFGGEGNAESLGGPLNDLWLRVQPVAITPPELTSISPNYGAPSASINIVGDNFGPTQGSGSVTVGGAPSQITAWSNTAITIRVPSKAVTGSLVVSAGGEASNGVPFTFFSFPAPTAFSTTSGSVGTPVTITGTNLLDGEGNGAVTFNGTPATILSQTSTSIQVNVPLGATTGFVNVRVNGVTSRGTYFTVLTPQINAISPNYGAPSARINITGNNFGVTQGSGSVTVGGAPSYVTSWANTEIAIQVPTKGVTAMSWFRSAEEPSAMEFLSPTTHIPRSLVSRQLVVRLVRLSLSTDLICSMVRGMRQSVLMEFQPSSITNPALPLMSRFRLVQPADRSAFG